MSVWEWFNAFQRDALERHDRDRVRLCQAHGQAYSLREKDPDQAFLIFSEARQLARQLDEPWMVLFYDHWCLSALMHFKRDYRNVLDRAVQAALDARKPTYAAYPGRLSAFGDVIDAYIGIDPAGYAGPVQEAMAFLDREIPPRPDAEGRYALLGSQRTFYQELDRNDEALEIALKTMALSESDHKRHRAEHWQVFNYCALCGIAAARGDWDNLAGWSEAGDDVARRVGHQVELSELLAWRAAVARRQGEAGRALRLHRSAMARLRAQRMPPERGFYDAVCLYHELGGDFAAMLAARDRELKEVSGWGRFHGEAHCRVSRCRLLARMGLPRDEEIAAAREAAAKLRDPAPLLARLEAIA